MDDVGSLLDSRSKTHGDFSSVASISQRIKLICRQNCGPGFDLAMLESLDMIATKIARILAGNPREIDHWADIEGYARLIRERISG